VIASMSDFTRKISSKSNVLQRSKLYTTTIHNACHFGGNGYQSWFFGLCTIQAKR